MATVAEIAFAFFLIVGWKTEFMVRLSGFLLLILALSMTFSSGIKGAFDYSVFTAAAGAFALGQMKDKFLEIDQILRNKKYNSFICYVSSILFKRETYNHLTFNMLRF